MKSARFAGFAAWLGATILVGQTKLPRTECGVNLHFTDFFGQPLPFVVETFRDSLTGEDFAQRFRGTAAASVPCGRYEIVLVREVAGAKLRTKDLVRLSNPREWVTIAREGVVAVTENGRAISVDAGGLGVFAQGSVTPPRWNASTPRWITFMSAFGSERRGVPIEQDGSFRVYGYMRGVYIAIIHVGEEIVSIEKVTFNRRMADMKLHFVIGQDPASGKP